MGWVTARRFHALLEPIAASIYFSPEASSDFRALGLDETQAYVCSRSAAMGRVAADVVVAAFYSFDADMIRTSLRWDISEPARVLETRMRAARDVMRRLLAREDGSMPELYDVVTALRLAVDACRPEGRPLAAAHAALPWPDDSPTALWHAATVLREFRGDGHIAVLQSHGIDAPQALALDAAWSGRPAAYYEYRRLTAPERERALAVLRGRGFLDADGALTDGGAKFREMLEVDTDRLASPPFAALSEERCERTIEALVPLVAQIGERRGIPRFLVRLFRAGFPEQPPASGIDLS
jgi:hypothetical protein